MDHRSAISAYRRYASIYDFVFGPMFKEGRLTAMDRVNREGGRDILEIGVGTGLTLPQHRADNRITGIDVSPDMLERAQRRIDAGDVKAPVNLYTMSAEALDFGDASFDTVMALYVMTVVDDPAAAASEMARVCRPGGSILLCQHLSAERPGLRKTAEAAFAPLSDVLGWHSVFPSARLDAVCPSCVEETGRRALGLFGLFTLVEWRRTDAPAPPRTPRRTVAAGEVDTEPRPAT